MPEPKKIRKLSICLLIIFFVFSPFDLFSLSSLNFGSQTLADGEPYVDITEDTTWNKDTPNLVFDKPVIIENGATLTIEKGVTIKFEKSSDPYNSSGIYVYDGNLVADGSSDQHVKFTSDHDDSDFIIDFYDYGDGMSSLRYVEISRGGNPGHSECGTFLRPSNPFFSTAFADENSCPQVGTAPALEVDAGKVHIENSFFHDNYFVDMQVLDGLKYDESGNATDRFRPQAEVINSNFSDANAIYADMGCQDLNTGEAEEKCAERVYLKDDWYGDSAGPTEDGSTPSHGGNIRGYYKLDSFRTNDLVVDPVIVIPGIMGTAGEYPGNTGQQVLDPILHIYDNLLESFKSNGYEDGKNLFTFPYNWRESNKASAFYLQNKIEEVISKTKISKVDLVAHSMGGLVARAYIEETGDGVKYQNTVDKLILLGTPNKGAPKAYLYWEAGEGFFSIPETITKHHFTQEAKHAGYEGDNALYSYIQKEVPAVGELLPDYDYLKDATNGNMKEYYTGYPRNTFLEDLNKDENLAKLKKVYLIDIEGNVSNSNSTISYIKVIDACSSDGRWKEGMPENFSGKENCSGLEKRSGDGTVPLYSAQTIALDKEIKVDSAHSDLPTKAQCDIIKELTRRESCNFVDNFSVPNIFLVNVFSPVDIQVIAPDGKHWIGKNIQNLDPNNQISGAFYTGSDALNEFATIPNPEDGQYQIVTEGTGSGAYTVEVVKISKDENNPEQANEAAAEIRGTASLGKIEAAAAIISGDGVAIGNQDTAPPEINIASPESKVYKNNLTLDIKYAVSDDQSAPNEIQAETEYDGQNYDQNKIDLALEHLGEHTFSVVAQDAAGNRNSKAATFEITTDIDAILADVLHYSKLGLITNRGTEISLEARLQSIKAEMKLLDALQSRKMAKWLKGPLEKGFRKSLDRRIDELETQLQKNKNFSKTIDGKARQLLAEDLESLKV